MGPVESDAVYTAILLYAFFKFVVIFHAAKNQPGYFWLLLTILPVTDFYYYFKFIKVR